MSDATIRTQRLELVDTNDELRGIFTTDPEGGVILSLMGGTYKAGVSLFAKGDGSTGLAIQTLGDNPTDRVQILVTAEGEPRVDLRDANGKIRVTIVVSNEDGPLAGFVDENGQPSSWVDTRAITQS